MARMAVWGFLCTPAVVYISLTSAFGASSLWTGTPAGRWFGIAGLRDRLSPPGEATLSKAVVNGAIGGLVGLACVSIILVAWLVICLAIVFFGPGPAILLLWLGVVILSIASCTLWGAVIGALTFCKRQFGWPSGIAIATAMIAVSNLIIALVV